MIIGLDISVLNDRQRRGIAVYTYNLIDAVLKINTTDKFILFGFSTFETFNFLKDLPFKNYPNVEMIIYPMPARFFRMAFLVWQKLGWPSIESFIGKVDIFHSFNWYMPPQRYGKKVGTVFDLTSIIYPKWHDQRTAQLDKIRFNRLAYQSDLIITISKNSKKDFQKLYPKINPQIIYPAASSIFNTKIDKRKTAKVLKKYGLSSGYFLSVSTLEPRKNLAGLIKAYLSIKSKVPLVFVGGKGWKDVKISKLLKVHKDKLKAIGFVEEEELVILYQQALCLIYPSFYEGFGLPALEAMSVGTPTLLSNTSSLKEVGGDAALYMDPKNIDSIKKSLIRVEKDKKIRKKLRLLGLKQAKKFSWEKSAKRLNSLYHQNYPKQ